MQSQETLEDRLLEEYTKKTEQDLCLKGFSRMATMLSSSLYTRGRKVKYRPDKSKAIAFKKRVAKRRAANKVAAVIRRDQRLRQKGKR